jgi:hypothetical protein
MNASSLLADLSSRGVEITLAGDDIQVQASPGEITQVDIQAIREHKVELLNLLADSAIPSRWNEYHDAIQYAFTHPSPRSAIGSMWLTSDWPDPVDPPGHPPGTCSLCGTTKVKKFPIHSGRSIRVECAWCGPTHEFSTWNPPASPPAE